MPSIKLDVSGNDELRRILSNLTAAPAAELEAAARAGADVILQDAARGAPGPHIEMETVSNTGQAVEIEIGPDRKHWYYKFDETGAAPHEITATNARLLSFYAGGRRILARSVHHTGMAARPFLRPAADSQADAAAARVGDVLLASLKS